VKSTTALLYVLLGLSYPMAHPPSGGSVLARVHADINGDRADDLLEILLIHGERVVDELPCANCGERVEGHFAARVTLHGGPTVVTSFNDLFQSDSLSFWAKPWRLNITDYNSDHRPDFNLGQYGTSNGWVYRLFTISEAGVVSVLKVPNDGLFIADSANSTKHIRIESGGFSKISFANCCEDEEMGWWTMHYRWNPQLLRFEVSRSEHHGAKRP
jgi:hypothetical protein